MSVGGSFAPGGEFTVTAYVKRPTAGLVVTLSLPDDFDLAQGSLRQMVPALDLTAATRNSPVTWRVQAPRREGSYTVTVRSSTGGTQTQRVSIKAKTIY